VRFWGARPTSVFLDRALEDTAATDFFTNGDIEITFNPEHFGSARSLLSTAYHEGVIHIGQRASGNYANKPRTGFYVNEVEALDREIEQAGRLGLTQDEIQALNQLRSDAYSQVIGTPYQGRVDVGNYQLQ